MEPQKINLQLISDLHDAMVCLQRAQTALRHDVSQVCSAVQRELTAAAICLSRALTLAGEP